jgi:hypothetical protein
VHPIVSIVGTDTCSILVSVDTENWLPTSLPTRLRVYEHDSLGV